MYSTHGTAGHTESVVVTRDLTEKPQMVVCCVGSECGMNVASGQGKLTREMSKIRDLEKMFHFTHFFCRDFTVAEWRVP